MNKLLATSNNETNVSPIIESCPSICPLDWQAQVITYYYY